MNEHVERQIALPAAEPRSAYDVVIVGGGGHGLATAYYLASRHGITDVCVLERGWIGVGNSGRNTTVIRANYGIPEAVRFYQRSLELYEGLEAELGRDVMHRRKGLVWVAHSEVGLRAQEARAAQNAAYGTDTEFVGPDRIAELCPDLDLTGGGAYPIVGGTYHPRASTARHDRVVWGYAEAAARLGVDVCPGVEVTGLVRAGDRVTGVETARGTIAAGAVVCAVGARASAFAALAGVRLPVVTHPLQAFVTDHYAQRIEPVVVSSDLMIYLSQTPRGEILVGAEIDPQPGYATRSGFDFLAGCAHRATTLLPCLRDLRILRQWGGACDMTPDYSPIIGATGVDGLAITTGWGTWGFKGIPAGASGLAELIGTGRVPDLIAPFALDRFARDRTRADRGSAGTH